MSPNGKKANLLSSWKEIAAYLDHDVRTCVRWEKQFGLPVHRLEKDAKGKVFGFTDEIDRWLESRVESLSSEKKKTGVRRWLWPIIVPVPVILLALIIYRFAGGHHGDAPPVPTDFRIQSSTLIVLDQEGRKLWRFDTKLESLETEDAYREHFQTKSYTKDFYPVFPYLKFCDINGDGRRETLFSLQTKDELNEGILICFDEKGTELWRFQTGRELVFGGKVFRREYRIVGFDVADINGDGKLEVFTISVHRPDWPCQFAVLDAAGKRLGEFWNSGHLADAILGDIDGDGKQELVLSGVNNGYETGCAVIFKDGRIAGGSPQEDGESRCAELAAGTETAYILFPTSDVIRTVQKAGDPVCYVWSHPASGFTAMSRLTQIYFDFNSRLECTNVALSHRFEDMYDGLVQRGRLAGPLVKPAYERKLADAVRIFQDGTWRTCRRLF